MQIDYSELQKCQEKNLTTSKPVLKHEKRLFIFVKNTEKQWRAVPCVGMFLRGDKEQLDKSSMESDGWPPGNTMGGLKAPLQSLKHKKQYKLKFWVMQCHSEIH